MAAWLRVFAAVSCVLSLCPPSSSTCGVRGQLAAMEGAIPWDAIAFTQSGQTLLKFGRRGNPHYRYCVIHLVVLGHPRWAARGDAAMAVVACARVVVRSVFVVSADCVTISWYSDKRNKDIAEDCTSECGSRSTVSVCLLLACGAVRWWSSLCHRRCHRHCRCRCVCLRLSASSVVGVCVATTCCEML